MYHTNDSNNATANRTLRTFAPVPPVLMQIKQAKNDILAEFSGAGATQDHLLRLALIEAEALAWQTGFPQLVFPTLATEKARAVADWHARQRSMPHTKSLLACVA